MAEARQCSVDELTELRTSLCRGAWRRLTDPRLDLAVLERPDVWPAIVRACAKAIALDALDGNRVPIERVLIGVPHRRRANVLLTFARIEIDRRPRADWEAALAVLERWPA